MGSSKQSVCGKIFKNNFVAPILIKATELDQPPEQPAAGIQG